MKAPSQPGARRGSGFSTIEEFAKALNRLDPIAIELAGRQPAPDIVVDGLGVKKLLGTLWFRSIFPRLSQSWRESLLSALAEAVVIPDHGLPRGRETVHLASASYEELRDIAATTAVTGAAGTDLQLLLDVMRLWGPEARSRLRFVEVPAPAPSRFSTMLGLLKRDNTA